MAKFNTNYGSISLGAGNARNPNTVGAPPTPSRASSLNINNVGLLGGDLQRWGAFWMFLGRITKY